jgi:hypothetical protein
MSWRTIYSIQHCVIEFVSDLQQVSPTNKTDRHDIIEILLKVALSTITLTTFIMSSGCQLSYMPISAPARIWKGQGSSKGQGIF